MATLTDIKNCLSFPADPNNPFIQDGRTVGDAEIARLKAWFEATQVLLDSNGDPRPATPNDFAAWLHAQLANQVLAWEHENDLKTIPAPAPLNESV